MNRAVSDVVSDYQELTRVLRADLMIEYTAGRITGDTYAQVYSQLMQAALQQSSQLLAVSANADLIKQKIITEKAQVQDIIEELVNVTDDKGTVEGSIGKQKDVYDKQIEAFRDKALQDFANNILNTWSVRRTTDPDTLASKENLLTDLDIGKTIKHLADHLGVELPDPEPAPEPEPKP